MRARLRAAMFLACLGTSASVSLAARAEAPPAPLPHVPGWLGVALSKSWSGQGVLVSHVVRTSPADSAGLRDGDEIASVDDVACASPSCVTTVVSSHAPGATVRLRVKRSDAFYNLSATLERRPAPDALLRREYLGRIAPEIAQPGPSASQASQLGSPPASLESVRGSVVLVDFWATWCGPCRATIPMIRALHTRYGASGLRVLGITTENAEKVASFAMRENMNYGILLDRGGDTTMRYSVTSFPSMFLVDKKGVVREVWVGVPDPLEVEARIKTLLAEPEAPSPGERGVPPVGSEPKKKAP